MFLFATEASKLGQSCLLGIACFNPVQNKTGMEWTHKVGNFMDNVVDGFAKSGRRQYKQIYWMKNKPILGGFFTFVPKKIKSCYWSSFINHLLTKLVQLRCLDVSLVLYLQFYKPQLHPSPLKRNKITQADISYLDLSLVNNPDIPL